MPWKEVSAMLLREEFVVLARAAPANVAELCRRFGISRKTGYKWLAREQAGGKRSLVDASRRPHASPLQTSAAVEALVVKWRQAHPAWGGRKLRARLLQLGESQVPAASTIQAILRRHGLIDPVESTKHHAWQRFEYESPNDLWQMDFKGHFAMTSHTRCHPLTVLDDHSRFSLTLLACENEQTATVQNGLTATFRRYGLPRRMLADNGSPWGCGGVHSYTPLAVWLIRLGVRVMHGRPYHPQTQGKEERFHRTLQAEVLQGAQFDDLRDCQQKFDRWRDVYNLERPPMKRCSCSRPPVAMSPAGNRFPRCCRRSNMVPAIPFVKSRPMAGSASATARFACRLRSTDTRWPCVRSRTKDATTSTSAANGSNRST
jgi:transposase InsO family protein